MMQIRNKRAITMLLTLAMVFGMFAVFPLTVSTTEPGMSNFVEVKTYSYGMFTDVNESLWYGFDQQKAIASAYEYGLMVGNSDTIFDPSGNVTLAQAITIAARVHSIYTTGMGDFVQEGTWYQVYVDYAIANGIIHENAFTNYSNNATRAEMAFIFSRSLPQAEFAERSPVLTPPDVNSGTLYRDSILALYKAGILTGSDAQGTFNPNSNITRAEASAIISRVILPAKREGDVTPVTPTTPPTPPTPGVTTYKVGVSISNFDDALMTLHREEIRRYFDSLETGTVKYDVTILDGKGVVFEQIKNVASFITQMVDVMIIDLVLPSSAKDITQIAKDADIPIVYINRQPSGADMSWDKSCYVGTHARQAGTFQGEIIRDLPDRGDADGDGTVRYVMIVGDPESIDAQQRTQFPIFTLTDAGIHVEKLFEQRGDWTQERGRQIAADALAQYGAKIDVIFCNNDAMALGALQAIKNAGRTVGRDIYLVGVDGIPAAIAAVRTGDMTGTVQIDYIAQAKTAADAAVRYMNGQSVDGYIWVDCLKFTG